MKVRIFLPAVQGSEHTYDGHDYDFEVLPAPGQLIRLTDYRASDFTVTDVGFLQEDSHFITCVWTKPRDTDGIDEWVASYEPTRG